MLFASKQNILRATRKVRFVLRSERRNGERIVRKSGRISDVAFQSAGRCLGPEEVQFARYNRKNPKRRIVNCLRRVRYNAFRVELSCWKVFAALRRYPGDDNSLMPRNVRVSESMWCRYKTTCDLSAIKAGRANHFQPFGDVGYLLGSAFILICNPETIPLLAADIVS